MAQLELQAPALACADGAELVDPRTGLEIEHTGIAGPAAEQVREVVLGAGLAAFLMVADGIVHDDRGDAYSRYVSNWSPELRRVPAVESHPSWTGSRGISAIVALGDEQAVRSAALRLRTTDALEVMEFSAAAPIAGVGDGPLSALLLHARGVDKGTALERVAVRSGCLPSEVAAVGDWLNDIAMFRAAGRSFAMAQAPTAVRAAATDRLKASAKDGGGVAEAIACILRDG